MTMGQHWLGKTQVVSHAQNVTWSDKKGLIARQILTIISRFEIL